MIPLGANLMVYSGVVHCADSGSSEIQRLHSYRVLSNFSSSNF